MKYSSLVTRHVVNHDGCGVDVAAAAGAARRLLAASITAKAAFRFMHIYRLIGVASDDRLV